MSKTDTRKTGTQDAQEQSRKTKVKATFKEGALRPAKKLDLDEGEEVEIEITKRKGKMFGALKDWSADSQKLKEELRSTQELKQEVDKLKPVLSKITVEEAIKSVREDRERR